MFKKLSAILLLSAATLASAASSTFFVVIPNPGKALLIQNIDVQLAGQALPTARVGEPYAGFDFKPLLTVTGDEAYVGEGVTWSVDSGSLPQGLVLNSDGTLSGTALAQGTSNFSIKAVYMTKAGVQAYQVMSFSLEAELQDIAFGSLAAGSYDGSALLTNTGSTELALTAPTASSVTGVGFAFRSTTCGVSLPVGDSCLTTVRWTASGTAASSGSLSIDTAAGTKVASLTGQSLQAVLGLDRTSHAFGDVDVGSTATSSVATLTNHGNTDANGLTITPPTGYTLSSNSCGSSLAAGASCSFAVTFAPSDGQPYNGNLAFAAAGAAVPSYSVTGTGVSVGHPYAYTIASNATNFNLFNAAKAAGWDGVSPLAATVTVAPGVYLVASTTANYAFDTGAIPAGSTLKLINKGVIAGRGGDGGKGAAFLMSTAAFPGGPAVRAQAPLTIVNDGIIGGGGGGGGGGNEGNYNSVSVGGSGGGGGRPNGAGGVRGCGSPSPYGTQCAYAGTPGTLTAPGTGGPKATSNSGEGGNGGNLGQPGSRGGPNGGGGLAGAAGAAVVGSGFVTITGSGQVLGALN